MQDASGWMWIVVDVIFVAALAAALIYGTLTWHKRRSRGMQQIRDDKTRANFTASSKPDRPELHV